MTDPKADDTTAIIDHAIAASRRRPGRGTVRSAAAMLSRVLDRLPPGPGQDGRLHARLGDCADTLDRREVRPDNSSRA